jgi:hypothetical protein
VFATVSQPRPGDFPVGCAKSRAAARALTLARQPQLTQYDLDCLLYRRDFPVMFTRALGLVTAKWKRFLHGSTVES